jgi:predicted secreted protein
MAWTTLAAIWFVTWWIVLFAVLPFGVRVPDDDERTPGADPGAPEHPRLVAKALWTTLVSTLLVGAFWAAVASGLVDLTSFTTLWGLFPR